VVGWFCAGRIDVDGDRVRITAPRPDAPRR